MYLWFCLLHTLLFGGSKIPSEPSLLKAEQTASFRIFNVMCSSALKHFVALHWTCSRMSVSYSCWRGQNWTQYSRCHLGAVEQKKYETSLDLLLCILANAGQGAVCMLCCKDTAWLACVIFVKRDHLSLSARMLVASEPPACGLLGADPRMMQDVQFAFVALHEVSVSPFFCCGSSSLQLLPASSYQL